MTAVGVARVARRSSPEAVEDGDGATPEDDDDAQRPRDVEEETRKEETVGLQRPSSILILGQRT